MRVLNQADLAVGPVQVHGLPLALAQDASSLEGEGSDDEDDTVIVRSAPLTLALTVAVIMTVLVGVWASPFLQWAEGASRLLP